MQQRFVLPVFSVDCFRTSLHDLVSNLKYLCHVTYATFFQVSGLHINSGKVPHFGKDLLSFLFLEFLKCVGFIVLKFGLKLKNARQRTSYI